MNKLNDFTDEQLFIINDSSVSDLEAEFEARGYEYGWHKKIEYAGVIYILINPAFPNLVKIGYTDDVEKRLKTLNRNSGLPDPYYVYATYKVKKRLEDLKLHNLIDSLDSSLRHSQNREFYEMTPEKAYEILSAIAQINGDEDLLVLNPLNNSFWSPAGKKELIKEPIKERKKTVPRLNFKMMNIPIGSVLTYIKNENITVITADNENKVLYNGEVCSITRALALIKNNGQTSPGGGGHLFTYNGKTLVDIRKEMENKESN